MLERTSISGVSLNGGIVTFKFKRTLRIPETSLSISRETAIECIGDEWLGEEVIIDVYNLDGKNTQLPKNSVLGLGRVFQVAPG